MSETGFLYILITGIALLLFAVAAVFAFRSRPEPVKAPQPIIGRITEIRQDERGIFITGQLTDEGLATFPGDTILWQSLSFDMTPNGLINSISIVGDDSKPCKGKNGNICVAEGCYGEACRNVGTN